MGNEASSYDYGDFGSYGYGGYDDGVNRRNWSDVSQAALRREKKAQEKFATIKQEWESKQDDLPPGSKYNIPFLSPTEHLVEKVWSRFHKQIKKVKNSKTGQAGCWDLKRHVADPEMRKMMHITRKSKVYFVNAIFKVPAAKTIKTKQQQSSGKQTSITSFVNTGTGKQTQNAPPTAAAAAAASVAAQDINNAKRSALAMTSPPSEQVAPVSSKKPRLTMESNTNTVTPGTMSKTNCMVVQKQQRQAALQNKTK